MTAPCSLTTAEIRSSSPSISTNSPAATALLPLARLSFRIPHGDSLLPNGDCFATGVIRAASATFTMRRSESGRTRED